MTVYVVIADDLDKVFLCPDRETMMEFGELVESLGESVTYECSDHPDYIKEIEAQANYRVTKSKQGEV